VVNQWGREGGGGRPARNGGGVIIPALISLVIGAGLGYGGARLSSGVSEQAISSRDQTISQLQQQAAEARGKAASATALKSSIADLQAEITALQSDNQRLTANNNSAAETEIASLRKKLAEMQAQFRVQADGDKALSKANVHMAALQAQLTLRDAALAKLTDADDRAQKARADLAKAQQGQQQLAAELADAQRQMLNLPTLQAENAALKAKLSKQGDQQDRAVEKQLDALKAQNDALNVQSSRNQAALTAEGEARQALEGRYKALDAERSSLAARVEELQAALNGHKPTADDPVQPPKPPQPPIDTTAKTPRDANDVTRAIENMPGYDGLKPSGQKILLDLLVEGECATTALRQVFGRVPAASLRNLLRDLNSAC
jgi:hypothetical protein